MLILESEHSLGKVQKNIAALIEENAAKFGAHEVFRHRVGHDYVGISWTELYENIKNISVNLKKQGLKRGDKIILFSPNCLEMLQLELAIMASGYVAVPIFAHFNMETASLLIEHSDARYVAVFGEKQLQSISPELQIKQIFVLDKNIAESNFHNTTPFEAHLEPSTETGFFDSEPDDICLKMYTSGTMGTPKCVQLTHRNILSQQAALKNIWQLDTTDRFLSYLPWHHSFGGIFELFTALTTGAIYHLESRHGKNPDLILENWKKVQPTVFFSVPKIYQSLFDLIRDDEKHEKAFFHPELKFIFTAAAALPGALSHEFAKRSIPVYEGWGLTETSPCCTITDPSLKRETGVVGKPIAGVTLRLGRENEIQVKGPNVMTCYYKNDEANEGAFTKDGWFCTGDVGAFTPAGLKLITRKDRIFKLSNGEKVIPTEMESMIQAKCPFVSFALVEGSGETYPVALLFPNRDLMGSDDLTDLPFASCSCPENTDELSHCLKSCLAEINDELKQKFSKVRAAAIIDEELSLENKTLTPSMKVVPNRVRQKYQEQIHDLYENKNKIAENVRVIRLDDWEEIL